ncbi:MAG: CTP-dependent riboflavin kinase [Desulfurococcales archaeon]|nr:CTP-dependent riboflavin kinase [Desulfurococcales archaeon]
MTNEELGGCEEKILRGTVFSGLGEGSYYMSIYSKSFESVLGFKPYPGTLNIRLLDERSVEVYEECLRRTKAKYVIKPPKVEGMRLAEVLVWPAYIRGLKVYIVRPVITVYTSRVVEVISEYYLRELLNLADGDRVDITLRCCNTNNDLS